MKLGKHPAKEDHRTIRLGTLLDETQADQAPPTVLPPSGVTWQMFGNDVHSDCTCAAAAHMILAWCADEKATPREMPTDALVLDLYSKVNGGQDGGAYALDVLNAWRTVGLGKDTITGYVKVDHNDLAKMKWATWVFGGLYIGLDLPLTAQAQGSAPWAVLPNVGAAAQPGSWGGHAVDVVGYDADGVTIVTWGREQRMTWEFWGRYCDESYAVFDDTDWLGDVPGFDHARLLAELARLS